MALYLCIEKTIQSSRITESPNISRVPSSDRVVGNFPAGEGPASQLRMTGKTPRVSDNRWSINMKMDLID
ncbi:hypothetical protein CEXT_532931 [Caerostris extrusa]|uniref:Uncharacterized protein n=1 Tax=Caerostris extrusa TaxID=172846 RepID=A0AAV4PNJ8_CAEEX|nr:hypothetical protein CEXT_532931 [Caerostris extrusa]